MKRTIVIGDIHGCFDELSILFEMISLDKSDTVISCGDIIDKGKFTHQCVKFLFDLKKQGYDIKSVTSERC